MAGLGAARVGCVSGDCSTGTTEVELGVIQKAKEERMRRRSQGHGSGIDLDKSIPCLHHCRAEAGESLGRQGQLCPGHDRLDILRRRSRKGNAAQPVMQLALVRAVSCLFVHLFGLRYMRLIAACCTLRHILASGSVSSSADPRALARCIVLIA